MGEGLPAQRAPDLEWEDPREWGVDAGTDPAIDYRHDQTQEQTAACCSSELSSQVGLNRGFMASELDGLGTGSCYQMFMIETGLEDRICCGDEKRR